MTGTEASVGPAAHRWPRSMRIGALLCVLAVFATLAVGEAAADPPAAGDDTVLIYGPSVSGGAGSIEATAASALGFTVDVVDAATWSAMSTAQFDSYRAIILGDPTCSSGYLGAAEANVATWSPVIDGNVVINGTDPVFHAGQGGQVLTEKSVAFAVDEGGRTGLYVSLSCEYDSAGPFTPVPVLAGLGAFTVETAECHNDAHIVATHPAIDGLTDADLSNWSCSVHEQFDSWPGDFLVLAIAERADGTFTAPDGSVGFPYILARGEGLVPIGDPCDEPTIVGTDGRDRIHGTPGPDVIDAGPGDDWVYGGGGDDIICGRDGRDRLDGGSGDDEIYGEAGNDTVEGGSGNDVVSGGDGNDLARGGSGNDTVDGDAGNDTVAGDAGVDEVFGGSGDDGLAGGTGAPDRCDGEGGSDTLSGFSHGCEQVIDVP